MKRAGYKKKIIRLCKDAGTYADYFEMTYDNLAYLLEVYDKAKNQFKASGEKPVIAYTNTAGKTNLVENPALTAINKLSATMLTYYEKLGLTPKGLKSLGENIQKEENSLEGILSNLGI
jgi:phage terminase small subunit